jgi:hypothetical protein
LNRHAPTISANPGQKAIGRPRLLKTALLCLILSLPSVAWAAEIDSVKVDRVGGNIIVAGSGFDGGTSFTLGGVAVGTDGVTANLLNIPFSVDVASAVMWRGTYNLVADGTTAFSVYIAQPIEDPTPPPPPPPPPPGGTTCPCIDAWQASGIPKDNFTLCFYQLDGTQESTSGQRGSYFISTAFDPNYIFFDPVDPGNSVSYCALHDGTSWTVAEPVVNQDEFDDCDHWMWIKICI